MIKKTKPNIAIPSEFAVVGEKRDFSEVKIQNGFDPFDKDTLEGSCLNKFIDDTYKGLNYSMAGTDAINLIKEGETLTSKNGNLESMPVVSTDLTGLTASGDNRLHALKGYLDDGELLTDAEGLADVVNYAHSTFDRSKFTVVGTPTITDDGIASGITRNSIDLNFDRLNLYNASTWSVEFGVYVNSNDGTTYTVNTGINFTNTAFPLSGGIYLAGDGRIKFYRANIWAIQSQQFNAGDFVRAKLSYNNAIGTYSMYVSVNNSAYTLVGTYTPDDEDKRISGLNTSGNIRINAANSGGAEALSDAELDLKYISITADGVDVFNGNKTGLDIIKPDNYEVVGTPTITADGIASGFTNDDYLTKSITLDSAKTFDIHFKFRTPETVTIGQIIGNSGSPYPVINYRLNAAKTIMCEFSMTSSTRHYTNSTFTVTENTDYFAKISYDKTNVKFYISLDNENWITLATLSNITDFTGENTFIEGIGRGIGSTTYANPFTGSIDLNAFKIYVDGNLVYQPCLKIPYTLSKTGSKIADASVRNRVVDMYGQYGYAPYYTLDEANGNFTLPQGEIYGMIEKSKTTGFLGQTVFSLDPLFNDGLHLLDGALLQGDGVYESFIDNYIKPLYNSTPSRFVTETAWQQSVSTYGVCGFYVYDSTNNTVRLPKVTGFVEGTLDGSALGSLVEAGLPSHSHSGTTDGVGNHIHGCPQGTVENVGGNQIYASGDDMTAAVATWVNSGEAGAHSHSFTTSQITDAIYGNSNTVQPQSIKGYMYIVVANNVSSAATVNQSGIITEVANKLDTDGSNAPSKLSEALLSRFMPDYENVITASFTSGVWMQVTKDSFVVSEGTDSYAENYSVYVSPNQSTLYKVGGRFDDTNGNTQTTSFSFFVPKNWYFKNEAENGGTHYIYPLKGAN